MKQLFNYRNWVLSALGTAAFIGIFAEPGGGHGHGQVAACLAPDESRGGSGSVHSIPACRALGKTRKNQDKQFKHSASCNQSKLTYK